jgi:hypothetical protein
MSLKRWDNWTRISFVLGLLAIVVLQWVTSCQAAGSGQGPLGIAASLTVQGSGAVAPAVLARYDGNTFVGWADGAGQAEVFAEANGFPLYGPIALAAGRVTVNVRKPAFKWSGTTHEHLPWQAKVLFRDTEIAAWSLVFDSPPEK